MAIRINECKKVGFKIKISIVLLRIKNFKNQKKKKIFNLFHVSHHQQTAT